MTVRLFAGTVRAFSDRIDSDSLVPLMQDSFSRQMLYSPSPSEIASWANSLPVLREDLIEASLEDSGIILESLLPLSSKRLDAIVVGKGNNKRANAVVIELKQWRRA